MDKIVVANLKMDMNFIDIINYLKIINNKINSSNVIICPTNIFIPYFLKQNYQVGIQNVFYESNGAYTGEVSPKQAKSIGINYVLVGHGERRKYFDENDIIINKKIKMCLQNKLKVILCVGETKEEREMLKTNQVIKKQLMRALSEISITDFSNIIIAYEPIWAIGANIIVPNKEIKTVVDYIKRIIGNYLKYYNIKVLYGGSINEKSINEIKKIDNIDGILVGEASIKAASFLKIIEVIQKG